MHLKLSDFNDLGAIKKRFSGVLKSDNFNCIWSINTFPPNWIVIKKPDRPGIITALDKAGGKIDLCHYDSDKSWWGRHYAYPILWNALNSKGLFISDDIQDNLYFCEFIKNKPLKFAVVEFKGKFVGLIRKPWNIKNY